jgi:uncharacterized protein YbjT (DUF2867 family)
VIAAILQDPAQHAGKTYPLYGSRELSQYEIAEMLTEVLGHKITYLPLEIVAFKNILQEMGFYASLPAAHGIRLSGLPERSLLRNKRSGENAHRPGAPRDDGLHPQE